MSDTVYFSICSRNYLAYARTLFRSLARNEPAARRVLFLADRIEDAFDPAAEPFETVEVESLAIPNFRDMAFRYTVMEFNTAVKPFCIRHLFGEGAPRAVYLDPDLYILRPMAPVTEAFDAGADVVLTPHILAPYADDGKPDDLAIMRSGVYNLGFGGFANAPETRALVDWWAERLRTDCRADVDEGLFVDQKFMDFAPAFVRRTAILRHPGLNAAYWNLPQRTIERAADGWTANGEPLVFFHFSGVVPDDREVFSKHQDRYRAADLGEARALLEEYLDSLAAEGCDTVRTLPYVYGAFDDGAPIPETVRRLYRRRNPRPVSKPDPFSADRAAYLRPSAEVPAGGAVVTELMYEIWRGRADLQAAFPLGERAGRASFANWFATSGVVEHGLPEDLAPTPPDAAPAAGGVAGAASRAVLKRAGLLRPLYARLPLPVRARARRALLRRGFGAEAADAAEEASTAAQARSYDPALDPGLALIGYLRTESGVGEGARRAYRALEEAGVDVEAVAVGTGGTFKDDIDETPVVGRSLKRANLLHVNADQMLILDRLVPRAQTDGRYAIGFWAWELERFPDAWSPAFDRVDEIWTPSAFVARAVGAKTALPVRVMPHPVEPPRPASLSRADFGLPEEGFIALAAFDLNSYRTRKNPEGAVAAFRRAFEGVSDARLVVKMHGAAHDAKERAFVHALGAEDPRIMIEDRVMDRAVYAALQSVCDVYVSLHRSEGFGLNLAECMALGKPVVATGYSGNMEFMDEAVSVVVPYSMIDLQPGDYPFAEGQKWADPDVAFAADALARLAADPSAARALGEKGRQRIEERLANAVCGERMASRLAAIERDVYAAQPSGGDVS